ncbi:MAG: LLM class flavin-dependent oxidoreductase [Candidatus Thorarchaeota archaeon]|jgi:alkanesulfonate monooxygenase SsuD/methylene tetrahydromethanopterin reductase-like flavin-dependent oxidoreductase (luciferase family)
MQMKYGINIPNFGWFGDIDTLVDIAVETEEAGWDGFFLWDHLLVFKQDDMVLSFVDPWIALTAIACNTKKIRLGPLITPLPRRRPWKVAREALSLDHLSKGRLVLGVGIGAPPDVEFDYFGEESDARIRAQMLDEGLDIITGLWSGEPFSFKGTHYQLEEMTFLPKPNQNPRIPIWVGGGVPNKAPFRRAARYDGVAPVHSKWPEPVTLQHLEDALEIIKSERGNLKNYDIVVCGETTGNDSTKDREKVEPWIHTGATWFLEDIHGLRAEVDELRERIRAGPPSV